MVFLETTLVQDETTLVQNYFVLWGLMSRPIECFTSRSVNIKGSQLQLVYCRTGGEKPSSPLPGLFIVLLCRKKVTWLKASLTIRGSQPMLRLPQVVADISKREDLRIENNDLHFVGGRTWHESGWGDQARVLPFRPPGGCTQGTATWGWGKEDPGLLVGNHKEQTTLFTGL